MNLVVGRTYDILNKWKLEYLGTFEYLADVPKKKGFYVLTRTMEFGIKHPPCDELLQMHADLRKVTMRNIANYKLTAQRNQNIVGDKFEITEEDNYLKIRLKELIMENNINVANYKHRFQNDNHYNNMKRLLVGNAPLSWEKFIEFLEIFEFEFQNMVITRNHVEEV